MRQQVPADIPFCIAEHHADELDRWPESRHQHYDVTGYSWHEIAPAVAVVAHVITVGPGPVMAALFQTTESRDFRVGDRASWQIWSGTATSTVVSADEWRYTLRAGDGHTESPVDHHWAENLRTAPAGARCWLRARRERDHSRHSE